MSLGEKLLEFPTQIGSHFYTALVRRRFAHWGAKSQIRPHAKLVKPGLVWIGDHVDELIKKAGLPAATRLGRCKVSRYRVMKFT